MMMAAVCLKMKARIYKLRLFEDGEWMLLAIVVKV